jgi:phenylalanine-4-hydroxylase
VKKQKTLTTKEAEAVEDLHKNYPNKILHWWTVEYGLIGTLDNPKIYGAGLLSSIGESAWCMTDEVQNFLIPLMLPMPILT